MWQKTTIFNTSEERKKVKENKELKKKKSNTLGAEKLLLSFTIYFIYLFIFATLITMMIGLVTDFIMRGGRL